ncbi:hypothetical protein SEA_XKCD426_38 [Streptomyces phage Xkcd426]|nr:hypothetical protein SEA_XKCD426_38 [Streptomyces phage Xkcd426]
MSDLKCPHCDEVRPSRSRLSDHMAVAHRNRSPIERAADLADAQLIEDVRLTGNELAEPKQQPQCVCGLPIEPLDDDLDYPMWTHSIPAPKCRDAIPAAGMPTKQDRLDLAERWAEVGEGLDRAGREMAEMRQQMDDVDARLARLNEALTKPSVVRRATLNQVWDKLVDEGHMGAAAIVMRMINRVVD